MKRAILTVIVAVLIAGSAWAGGGAECVAREDSAGKWSVKCELYVDGANSFQAEVSTRYPLATVAAAKTFARAVVTRLDAGNDIPNANKKWTVVVYAVEGDLED
jgi:hypothetical protein